MEAPDGTSSLPARRRRHAAERAADVRRALDWSTRPSDILLFPHSPLALADVLGHPEGRLDLLPLSAETPAAASDLRRENELAASLGATPVVSLQQRRRDRHPRSRVNLLTRHEPDELLERCRRVLVENALVKSRGERQLFLAAGFLGWDEAETAPGEGETRRRAPLLLYPVLLVRKPDEPGYELRLDGSHPIGNARLAAALHERHALTLPEPDPDAPLADYLARIAGLLSAREGAVRDDTRDGSGDTLRLELEFDVALGAADVPLPESADDTVRLPALPSVFDAELAIDIAGSLALDELQTVLQLLPDYAAPAAGENGPTGEAEGADTVAEPARDDIGRLRAYATELAADGLEHVEFRQLGTLPESLARWRHALAAALDTPTVALLRGDGQDIGARHLVRLAGSIELLDKAPPAIDHYAHPDLAFRATATLLRRARHQARLIEDELAALQDRFVLDKVPAKRELLNLIEELGGAAGVEPDIVDADYFNARRRFMEFSIDKAANLTVEHRRALGQLAKVMRFRELFVNNTEYRAALGPGYRGLRTDWTALEAMGDYAAELAEVLESETLAGAALASWPAFRRTFVADLETLQQAADATRRLLRLGARERQAAPARELLARADELAERVTLRHAEYGPVDPPGARTPGALLARFSGHEREDMLIELRVGETRTRIERLIAAGGTDRERAAATVAWLLAASVIAGEHRLGIEAITARLQLA